MDALEKKLDEVFVKKAPIQIPANGKKWIVENSPYLSVLFGILGLLAAWSFWSAAHIVDDVATTIDSAYRVYKIEGLAAPSIGPSFWIAWLALLVQSVIMITAYQGLKARSKTRGWNLLFYSSLISLVVGVFYGVYESSIVAIILRLIGSAAGLYLLFQIRGYYNGKITKEAETVDEPHTKKATKKHSQK